MTTASPLPIITRTDGAQVVSISAKPDDESVDVVAISRNFAPRLDAILNRHPELTWRYTGYHLRRWFDWYLKPFRRDDDGTVSAELPQICQEK
ncbi:MAG: hypothetical protein EHM17_08885 [Verrucomicrobiaceae bacterium]|nr:MAG: hypothetical protein EHM17_08885 [Verrucomicrobiaceae bacterium]